MQNNNQELEREVSSIRRILYRIALSVICWAVLGEVVRAVIKATLSASRLNWAKQRCSSTVTPAKVYVSAKLEEEDPGWVKAWEAAGFTVKIVK